MHASPWFADISMLALDHIYGNLFVWNIIDRWAACIQLLQTNQAPDSNIYIGPD